jgi:hypothetical protein
MKESVYANAALKQPDASGTATEIWKWLLEFQHKWAFSIEKYPKDETRALCRHVAAMAKGILAQGQATRGRLRSAWQEVVLPFEAKLARWVGRFEQSEMLVETAIPIDAYLQTLFVSKKALPDIRSNVIEFCLDARAYLGVLEYSIANDSGYQVKEYFLGWLDLIAELFRGLGDLVVAILEILRAALAFIVNLVKALPSALPWLLGGGLLVGGGIAVYKVVDRLRGGRESRAIKVKVER